VAEVKGDHGLNTVAMPPEKICRNNFILFATSIPQRNLYRFYRVLKKVVKTRMKL
jgi:hypothetical protein